MIYFFKGVGNTFKINRSNQNRFCALLPLILLCSITFSFAQQTYSGNVNDASGVPLLGVNVVIQGTSTGVATDFDGNYSITAQAGQILVFSSVGFQNQEVQLGDNTSLNITLQESFDFLDEIIVTGYGTQTRREVTASIIQVDAENIERVSAGSSVDAIKGQVAGVDITSVGARPGQSPQVRIRGRRSISASNAPLYVVDGIPVTSSNPIPDVRDDDLPFYADGGAIFDIAPQDIESMTILKDAAATAIYGSRGANGVILITTKRGKQGETTQVNYSGYYGVSQVANIPDMMNGEQYKAMRAEAFRKNADNQYSYDGTVETDLFVLFDGEQPLVDNYKAGKDFDYLKAVLRKGSQQSHNISARGGTEKTAYNASIGYFFEEGVVPGMDYERINARLNLDHRINDTFKFGMSTTLTQATNNWGSNAVMNEALRNLPLGRPYLEDGVTPRFNTWNDGIATNPLSEIVPGAYIDERVYSRIFVPTYLQINFNPDLIFTTTFGPDLRYTRRGEFRGRATNDNRLGPADAEVENVREQGFTLENLLTYNRDLGPGRMKLTLLQSIQQSSRETSKSEVLNLPYESQLWYNIRTAAVKGNLSSSLSEWELQSYMGRINYDIDGKYLLQASLRADGSSRLAEGNKWSYFPGVSLGWRINEEGFMENAPFDELKLRLSYGEVGNTSIPPYKTPGRLDRTVYSWGGSNAYGYRLDQIANPDLKWEISKTLDFGLDFTFLEGKISGSFDYYRTQTTDLLLKRNLPYTSGYESVFQNVGSTQTNGVEFGINAVILDNEDGLNFDVNFNISGYSEKITELALKDKNGNPVDDVGNKWFIGQPIRVFYDYQYGGIYQMNEVDLAKKLEGKDPGEIRRADTNGDGKITPEDRVILGTDVPDYYGGLTTNFSYKNWDFSAFFYFKQGQMINSNFHRGNNSLQGRYNNLNVDYWTPDNPNGKYPRPDIGQERAKDGDLLRYFDGSYVKLRNVTLGYNVETDLASKMGLKSLRLYLQGQNLWFSSKYETFDPEIGERNLGSGVAPSSSLWAFGIKANL